MNKLTHNSFPTSSVLLGALISVTSISGFILSSTSVSADDDYSFVDDITITVPEACTLSGTGMNSHTASITNGTYYDGDNHEGIGTTTLKAYCNDPGGFAIYAIGYTGDSYTGTNHTKLVGTNNNSNTIATGLATGSSSSDPSNWAMKLATNSGATYALQLDNGYGSYSLVPDTFTKVAHRDSGTDVGNNATGSTLTSTYAAYINGTQPSDTYVGKVLYTLVHPSTEVPQTPQATASNKICYYPNGGNVVGSMGCQTVSTSATSATLLASNFSREGYGFAGWSTTFDYSNSTGFYGPQEYITFAAGTYTGNNPGLSLYARWVKSAGNLQGWTGCPSLATGAVTALTDQRDGETYAIAKLADGNCWMIENLRLESTNSDNTTGALAQGYGTSTTYGNFSGLANAENANFTGSTSPDTAATEPNSLYYAGTQSGTASINISQTNYAGSRMPRYNSYNHQATSANRPQNPTVNNATNSTTNASMYSYGNYYTWAAAMANTSYYDTTTTDGDGYTPSEAANTSLCPKGWKLPYGRSSGKGATSGGFSKLDIDLGGTGVTSSSSTTPTGTEMSKSWRAFPNNFLYSGNFYESSASNRGSSGNYWSSTADSGGYSYNLSLYSFYVNPGASNVNMYNGYSIRCIAGSVLR